MPLAPERSHGKKSHLSVPLPPWLPQVGGSTVAAAISEATGVTRTRLRSLYNEMGDLGDVAQACKQTQAMRVAGAAVAPVQRGPGLGRVL